MFSHRAVVYMSFFCFFNSIPTSTTDSTNAEKSATGPASNTPIIPKRSGSSRVSGIKKKVCLVNAKRAPFDAFPIAVKKLEESNCTQKNKYMYKNIVYNHIIEHLGSIKLCNLTEDDCQRFINEYAGWSKTFASKVRMVLRRILTKAEKQELIKTNVAKDIVLPTVYENKHRPITDDERRMILETIPKHYAGTMVLTMLCCGLRPIEIRRMKWDWIDFENAILTVGKSKTEAGTGRKIPIPPVLLDALKEHKAKELNNEYVFVKYEKHTRMDDNAFYQSWKNFLKEMDLANGAHLYRNQVKNSIIAPDFEPYLLRHTFCTDCQAAGVPINVAKEWMGHSDISVTAKIYTHMVDEVFEQNRMRMAQYAVAKSQQVESPTATN